jgi:hypothetical protein
MANKELTDFVKQGLEAGQSRAAISNALRAAGWKADEIKDALHSFADIDFPIAVPRPRPYLSARVAFLYLLFFIMLAIVAWSLGSLLFAMINMALPDAANRNTYRAHWTLRQMRFGIAGLVVASPIFFFLARFLSKARQKDPALQRSQIRKWLTYLTLVAAGATLVGDAISLVYNLLNGDLTLRFILKSLVVAGIAGTIFIYLMRDAESGDGEGAKNEET